MEKEDHGSFVLVDTDDSLAVCRAKLHRLITVRERCAHEMRERLVREGFSEETVESVIEYALSTNLIDDRRYAEAFVAGKLHLGWGRARIERELEQNDIHLSAYPDYPEGFYGEEDELERALVFLSTTHTTARNLHDAYYRKLVTKGFSSDIAVQAARIKLAQEL